MEEEIFEYEIDFQTTNKNHLKRERQAYEETEREDREDEYIV